jgi:hypothetical protein
MEMHGSIAFNLRLAVESSRRLQGHPIHADTLQFWSDLIKEARSLRAAGEAFDDADVDGYIAELETVLAQHVL